MGGPLSLVFLKYYLVNKNIQVAIYVKRSRSWLCTFSAFNQHLLSYVQMRTQNWDLRTLPSLWPPWARARPSELCADQGQSVSCAKVYTGLRWVTWNMTMQTIRTQQNACDDEAAQSRMSSSFEDAAGQAGPRGARDRAAVVTGPSSPGERLKCRLIRGLAKWLSCKNL